MSPSASAAKAGTTRVEPPKLLTHCDTRTTSATARPMSFQTGRSRPNGKASTASTAHGMTISETSGTASALPITPKGFKAWKWKLPKGAVASVATTVVARSATTATTAQRRRRWSGPPGSPGGKRPRAHSAAAIRAATAA